MEKPMVNFLTLSAMGLDLLEYDRVIGELYEGALDPKQMAQTLRHLRELFQANYVTLILRVPDQPDLGLMIVAGNIKGEGEVSYLAYPQTTNPFANQPMDRVFTVDDVMSELEWEHSAYFKLFCSRQGVFHVMGADISTPNGGKFRFRITRPKSAPKFSAKE
ncbi:MAG: helix-turn-helix transcriptional regulator, partial [Pseudomonas sp.]